jgi:hypothetical protein
MLIDDIEYCSRKISEEERRAETAPSPESGCVHLQLAMLYKAQLASMLRHLPEEEATRLTSALSWPSIHKKAA